MNKLKAQISLMGMLCSINKLLKIKHILALVLVFMCVGAQISVAQIKKPIPIDELPELKVGDTVPEELWNHPMELWTAADGSVKTITLNDYRGKVIILDFWATWCGGCINYFPHMQDIQNQAGEGLVTFPVTYEDREKVQSFVGKTTSKSMLEVKDLFQSILGQSLIMFPRKTIPHIIVINKEGKIEAITSPQYLNHQVIAQVLKGNKDVYIPYKRFGFDKPRFGLSNYYSDVRNYGTAYYRAVIGFTDGIGHDGQWQIDSLNKNIRFWVANANVILLYNYTKKFSPLSSMHNRTILQVSQPNRYVYINENCIQADWRRKYWHAYEAVLPLDTSHDYARMMMKEDLDLFLGLDTRLEKRKVNCLVLKKLNVYIIPDSLRNPKKSEMRFLAKVINQKYYGLPYVVDEIGEESVWPRNIAIHEWKDLSVVRSKLRDYGLDLVPEVRELDMFVLTEKGHGSVPMDQLILTEYGYVPKSVHSQ